VKEILAIGKICHEVRENTYDLIVVDAEATGHFVAQVSAPDALMRVVQIGVVADQTAWMREILHDAARTTVVAVTTAEELPVSETIELRDRLRAATPTPIGAIVVNRVNPAFTMSADDVQAIAGAGFVDEVAAVTGARDSVAVVVDALKLAVERAGYQQSNVTDLHAAFGDDVAIRLVGEAPGESSATAPGVSKWIADQLGGADDSAR
jgi:anion-transporting  ArsA/GET3 family ATPase